MRIVDRTTFLALPAGTLFAKFGDASGDPTHFYFGEVCIKEDTCGNDFVVQDLTGQFEGWTGSESHFDELDRMVNDPTHESPPIDYDSAGRDGLFDEKQRFAVWSAEDARRLVVRLAEALPATPGDNPVSDLVERVARKVLDADSATLVEPPSRYWAEDIARAAIAEVLDALVAAIKPTEWPYPPIDEYFRDEIVQFRKEAGI